MSSHSDGKVRLWQISPGLTGSSESEQKLQHYREADPLQNLAAQYCSAAAGKVHKHCQIHMIHRNSHIEASVTFTQHPQCAQTQRHTDFIVNIPKKPSFKLHPAAFSSSLERLSAVKRQRKFSSAAPAPHTADLCTRQTPKQGELIIIPLSLTLKQTSER